LIGFQDSHALRQFNIASGDFVPANPLRFGKPCVRGTRITVGDVLGYLAGGMSAAEVVTQFPQLTPDDIKACLAYAAERERRTTGIPVA
jgi:uncharacterized protein (DUF433 family)